MKDFGKKIKKMEKADKYYKMVMFMKVNGLMIN